MFAFLKHPDWLWGQPTLLVYGYCGLLPRLQPQKGTPSTEMWSCICTPPFALMACTDLFYHITYDLRFSEPCCRLWTYVKNPDKKNRRLYFSKTLVSTHKSTRCHNQDVHNLILYELLNYRYSSPVCPV